MNTAAQRGTIQFTNPTINTEFDSGIPFISGNIVIPYCILPQVYVLGCLFFSFIFEQPFDLRILVDFYWIWLYLRFFMRTNFNDEVQIGDLSPEFAFTTFFPEKLHRTVEIASDICYAFFNMCGFVNLARNYLANRPIEVVSVKKQQFSPVRRVEDSKPDPEQKTKAMSFLNE